MKRERERNWNRVSKRVWEGASKESEWERERE